jgi:hypothetical protein
VRNKPTKIAPTLLVSSSLNESKPETTNMRQSVGGPAAIFVGKPMNELDTRWRPVPPNEFPSAADGLIPECGKIAEMC